MTTRNIKAIKKPTLPMPGYKEGYCGSCSCYEGAPDNHCLNRDSHRYFERVQPCSGCNRWVKPTITPTMQRWEEVRCEMY